MNIKSLYPRPAVPVTSEFIFDDNASTGESWNASVRAFHYAVRSHPGLVIVGAQGGSKPAVCKSN